MNADERAAAINIITLGAAQYKKFIGSPIKAKSYKKYANALIKFQAGDESALEMFRDEARVKIKQQREASIKNASMKRIENHTLDTYNFPSPELSNIAMNIDGLLTDASPNFDNSKKIVHRLLPDLEITDEYINEVISYYNIAKPDNSSAYTRAYSNPFKTFLSELASNYSSIPSTFAIIKQYTRTNPKDYNFIAAVGPGDKPYSIIIPDEQFKVNFLKNKLIIFVFERDDAGWGTLSKISFKDSTLFNYLSKEYNITEDSYTITKLSENAFSIKFTFRGVPIDIVYLNTYYIGLYKPILKSLITNADKSMVIHSIAPSDPLFQYDIFIRQLFTFYMYAPWGLSKRYYSNATTSNKWILINLEKIRGRDDIYSIIEEFIKISNKRNNNIPSSIRREELRAQLSDESMGDFIQFAHRQHLWNILGGRRLTRRLRRDRRQTRRA